MDVTFASSSAILSLHSNSMTSVFDTFIRTSKPCILSEPPLKNTPELPKETADESHKVKDPVQLCNDIISAEVRVHSLLSSEEDLNAITESDSERFDKDRSSKQYLNLEAQRYISSTSANYLYLDAFFDRVQSQSGESELQGAIGAANCSAVTERDLVEIRQEREPNVPLLFGGVSSNGGGSSGSEVKGESSTL